MEFGVFVQGHVPLIDQQPDRVLAEHEAIRRDVDAVVAADRAGFKYAWATEHHFLTEYSHLSANEVFLAYCAALTERIHLGSGIINVTAPVNHPARVAERVAMLDHLSDGRFEFGTGRGSSTTEQRGFGIEDPNDTMAMWQEGLTEIVRMWHETPYAHEGASFSMPPRDVLPKPWVAPHPPLWVAAGSPSTFERAGRLGLGVLCFATLGYDELAPLIEVYKKAVAEADPLGDFVNDNIAVATIMTCLPDRDRARAALCASGTGRLHSLVFRWLDTFPRPEGLPVWPDLIPEATPEDLELRMATGYAVVGDPDDCVASLRRYESIGIDQVITAPMANQWPTELALEIVECLGRDVIPRLDLDEQHSTNRARASLAS